MVVSHSVCDRCTQLYWFSIDLSGFCSSSDRSFSFENVNIDIFIMKHFFDMIASWCCSNTRPNNSNIYRSHFTRLERTTSLNTRDKIRDTLDFFGLMITEDYDWKFSIIFLGAGTGFRKFRRIFEIGCFEFSHNEKTYFQRTGCQYNMLQCSNLGQMQLLHMVWWMSRFSR